MVRQEIMKLNHDDILIICSGTNDLVINKTTLAFQDISNMVTKNNHTNIILVNIPYRYDMANTYTVKDGIEKFNKRLEKLTKISPHASFLKTE
jgi:RNase H-fold protein (predicted Holliday junction resolvase)